MGVLRALEDRVDPLLLLRSVRNVPIQLPLTLQETAGDAVNK